MTKHGKKQISIFSSFILLILLINNAVDICESSENIAYCPANYNLVNGLCYIQNQLASSYCPKGYYLSNNMCYPVSPTLCPYNTPQQPAAAACQYSATQQSAPAPCPYNTQQQSAVASCEYYIPQPSPSPPPIENTPPPQPATQPPTTSRPIAPELELIPDLPPETIIRCPAGSIFSKNRCRKIVCAQGEYYNGKCLQPVCPDGTVWHGRRCQKPGYVRTILQIENRYINEAHDKPPKVEHNNTNNYITPKPQTMISTTTTTKPHFQPITQTTPPPPQNLVSLPGKVNKTQECCSIITPRICKLYDKKWVCFHRRYKRCEANVCKHPKMYLKVSEVTYIPPLLIMPPNPPLAVCKTTNCDSTDYADCSGCQHNRRELCSSYCYNYSCPHGECGFLDLKEYCSAYPGESGCRKWDGCIWNWCTTATI